MCHIQCPRTVITSSQPIAEPQALLEILNYTESVEFGGHTWSATSWKYALLWCFFTMGGVSPETLGYGTTQGERQGKLLPSSSREARAAEGGCEGSWGPSRWSEETGSKNLSFCAISPPSLSAKPYHRASWQSTKSLKLPAPFAERAGREAIWEALHQSQAEAVCELRNLADMVLACCWGYWNQAAIARAWRGVEAQKCNPGLPASEASGGRYCGSCELEYLGLVPPDLCFNKCPQQFVVKMINISNA